MRRLSSANTSTSSITRAIQVLRDNRITEVIYRFSGSGDNGAMDSVDYIGENGVPVADFRNSIGKNYLNLRVEGNSAYFYADQVLALRFVLDQLQDYIESIARRLGDWCNGPGGYGSISLNVNKKSWHAVYTLRHGVPKQVQFSAKQIATVRAAVSDVVWGKWIAQAQRLKSKKKFFSYAYALPDGEREKVDKAVNTILATTNSQDNLDFDTGVLLIGQGSQKESIDLYWRYHVVIDISNTYSCALDTDEEDTNAPA